MNHGTWKITVSVFWVQLITVNIYAHDVYVHMSLSLYVYISYIHNIFFHSVWIYVLLKMVILSYVLLCNLVLYFLIQHKHISCQKYMHIFIYKSPIIYFMDQVWFYQSSNIEGLIYLTAYYPKSAHDLLKQFIKCLLLILIAANILLKVAIIYFKFEYPLIDDLGILCTKKGTYISLIITFPFCLKRTLYSLLWNTLFCRKLILPPTPNPWHQNTKQK